MGETHKKSDKNAVKRDSKGKWLPGHSPPGGRPLGTPNKLTGLKAKYLEGIEIAAKEGGLKGVADWLSNVATKDPVAYAKIMASLIPKESKVDVTQRSSDDFGKLLAAMPEDELKRMARAVDIGESDVGGKGKTQG